MNIGDFLSKAYDVVVQPIIFLLFAFAFLIFIWGLVEFIRDSDSDAGRDKGKKNILWGIVGMVIMVSVFGIINIIAGTLDVHPPTSQNQINQFQGLDNIDVKSDL